MIRQELHTKKLCGWEAICLFLCRISWRLGVGDGSPPARRRVRWDLWIRNLSRLPAVSCGVSSVCPTLVYGSNAGAIRRGRNVEMEGPGAPIRRGIFEGEV